MAGLREENKWENEIYRIEESDPVVGGEGGISNKPQKQLANRTQWLKAKINELFGKNTPKKITKDTTNLVANDGHTHEIEKGSLTTSGIVQLTDSVNQDSSVFAATAKAVKTAFDKAVAAYNLAAGKANATTNITAGNGLTGGGQLNANRTIAMGTPSSITATTTNSVTSTSHTHEIEKGSLTTSGIVQLTDSVNQDSSVFAATAKAVKTAFDKAVDALNVANTKLGATATAVAANKLATARTISLTGAVSGSGSFDGSGNLSINTADNLTIGLVTSTSATGISNVATSNNNTYLNVVETRGKSANAVGSSTRVAGTGLVDIYSDTAGLLTIRGNKDNSKLNTSGDQRLNGKLTVNDILLATNSNQSLSQVINAINTLFTGNRDGFKNIVNAWGVSGVNPMGVAYNFENPNAWYISMGPLFGNLIIQGGLASQDNNKNEFFVTYPVLANVIYISAFDVNYSNYIDHDYDTFNYSITEFIRLRTKTSATLLATSTTMGTVQWFSVGIA